MLTLVIFAAERTGRVLVELGPLDDHHAGC